MSIAEASPPRRLHRDLGRCRAMIADLTAELDRGEGAHLDDPDVLELMRDFERLRNSMSGVDHRLIAECENRRLAESTGHGTVARMLTSVLRLAPGESSRRVRAAAVCGPRITMTGEQLEPVRPVLAAAQAAGDVSPDQVQLIERALDGYDRPGFDPDDVAAGERLLTTYALTFGPRDLKPLANRVTAAIDPDGSLPDDTLNADRRHFTLRPTRDGAYVGEFRLTGSLGAKLTAVLTPLARPRLTAIDTDGGPTVTEVDPRSHQQRVHDAVEDLCDRALRSGRLPDSGGVPATVIVTMDVDDLRSRTGSGVTSDGATLSTTEILRLAGEAEIIPVVCTASGAVLDLGRSRRIASPTQTLGLIARDLGCSFPSCAHPPEYCERHHVQAWADGGETKLNNLTLVCRFHHRHFADRGWRCHIDDDGLPAWTPPRWIDREQRPLINHRILSRRLARQMQPQLADFRLNWQQIAAPAGQRVRG